MFFHISLRYKSAFQRFKDRYSIISLGVTRLNNVRILKLIVCHIYLIHNVLLQSLVI